MNNIKLSRTRRALMLATLAGATTPALGKVIMSSGSAPDAALTDRSAALDAPAGRLVLSGRVLNAQGVPVRGARLELAHEHSSVTTDADGRFLWTGAMPEKGVLQCRVGDPAASGCQMSADLWLAQQADEPYQLHASRDQDGVWRVGLNLLQAA